MRSAPAVPTFDARLPVPCWTVPHERAVIAFSTRLGGVSASPYDSLNLGRSTADDPAPVPENPRRLLHALALDPERLATAGQVHGVRVAHATTPELHAES